MGVDIDHKAGEFAVKLWPRLPLARAQVVLERQAAYGLEQLQRYWKEKADVQVFAPVGGVPVSETELENLRRFLDNAATQCGYPEQPSRAQKAEFDRNVAIGLVSFPMPLGEGVRPEVWAWIAAVLAPHVLRWRWAGEDRREVKPERGAGPIYRNAFGRLWHAARTLDRGQGAQGRWALLDAMGADQLVALLERPSLGSNPTVARAIAETWSALPATERRELLFREAMKAMMIHAALVVVDCLPEKELTSTIHAVFRRTAIRCRLSCSLTD